MTGQNTLIVNETDDLVVALVDLAAGDVIDCGGKQVALLNDVAAKHKFSRHDIQQGATVQMYGITVGKAVRAIAAGDRITTSNLVHATDEAALGGEQADWQSLDVSDLDVSDLDVSNWQKKSFQGYVRSDGRVGAANYWLVVPLVFCENRNLDVLRDALLDELGYGRQTSYRQFTRELLRRHAQKSAHAGDCPVGSRSQRIQQGSRGQSSDL